MVTGFLHRATRDTSHFGLDVLELAGLAAVSLVSVKLRIISGVMVKPPTEMRRATSFSMTCSSTSALRGSRACRPLLRSAGVRGSIQVVIIRIVVPELVRNISLVGYTEHFDEIDFAVSEGLEGMKVAHRRCGESPSAKLQRVSSEDCRTPVRGQVKQSAEMRSALELFATAHSFRERSLESVNCTGFENPLKILAALGLQRNTCASCVPRRPVRVRTLRTKLSVSWPQLATISRT